MFDSVIYPPFKPEYIGLRIEDGKLSFVFPCNYQAAFSAEEQKKDMINLLRLIDRYRTRDIIDDSYQKEYNFPFNAYMWIIKDFIENGYYKIMENHYIKSDKGKVNWKKTIKNNSLYLDQDNIVYKEMIVKKNVSNIENIITNIHKFCVKESVSKMGWFYNITENVLERSDYDIKQKEFMLNQLKSEYLKSYHDHKKNLILNMIKLLEGLDISRFNSKEFDLSTKEFEYVFERLIEERFSNCDVKDYYPQASWYIKDNQPQKCSKLRPDTILEYQEKTIVIDAKYYQYGYIEPRSISNLPDISSIHKQITYAEDVSIRGKENIYNLFILPASLDNFLEYVGYATVTWKSGKETYEKVHAILIDLKKLVNNVYENSNKERLINELNIYL